MACWENGTSSGGRGKGERTEKKVYVISTVKKKKVMWVRESYNKRCILSHFCPLVLFSKDYFHQASPFRKFPFVYMHKWVCMYTCIADFYYLQIPYLGICLLLKFICNPEINTLWIAMVICRHAKGKPKSESTDAHLPSWHGRKWFSAFLFLLSYCKQVSFQGLFNAMFFSFFCFFCDVWFCCLKWSPL